MDLILFIVTLLTILPETLKHIFWFINHLIGLNWINLYNFCIYLWLATFNYEFLQYLFMAWTITYQRIGLLFPFLSIYFLFNLIFTTQLFWFLHYLFYYYQSNLKYFPSILPFDFPISIIFHTGSHCLSIRNEKYPQQQYLDSLS